MKRTLAAILLVIVCCAPLGCGMQEIYEGAVDAKNALDESERIRANQRQLIEYLRDQLRACRADLLEMQRAVREMRAAYERYKQATEQGQ